ncbi:PREDICTED: anion exchange transporter-like, partial [Apaloderma vittatum]|uniref:anion exchange transporter-like n=1 Tax=Apaloderma vittatum TaxID=57397 RepID=UPI0005219147
TNNNLPYKFSLCIDYRAETLSLKNVKEVEHKYKTEDNCESLKQVKIVSANNPLIFLNARKFRADLIKIIQNDSMSSQACEDVSKCEQNTLLCSFSNGSCHGESLQSCHSDRRVLILDCSGLSFFDYTGVSELLQIYMDCKNRHIDVLLAHCKASLKKAMQYGGNLESENPVFFDSISSAIDAIQIHRAVNMVFPHKASLEQIDQRDCRVCILGDIQTPADHGPEQPAIADPALSIVSRDTSNLIRLEVGGDQERVFEDLQRQIFSGKLRHLMSNSLPSGGLRKRMEFTADYIGYRFNRTEYAKI